MSARGHLAIAWETESDHFRKVLDGVYGSSRVPRANNYRIFFKVILETYSYMSVGKTLPATQSHAFTIAPNTLRRRWPAGPWPLSHLHTQLGSTHAGALRRDAELWRDMCARRA